MHLSQDENDDEKKTHTAAIVFGILALLIAAAAGLFGGYEWGQHHEQTKLAVAISAARPGSLYSILNQAPNNTQTQPLSSADTSDKQQPQVLGASIVAPTTSAPATPVAQPTTKTYTYSGASIAITIPTSWTIKQSDQDGTLLQIFDAAGVSRGQLFIQAGVSETLDQKRTELEANPQVSNITDTTFHGIAALSYTQTGISGTNIVLEYNSNLYTFSQGAEQTGDGYSIKFL